MICKKDSLTQTNLCKLNLMLENISEISRNFEELQNICFINLISIYFSWKKKLALLTQEARGIH